MFSGKYDQPINSTLLMAKACMQLSILIGVLVTIIYCGTIDFYPSGLTIGDTLFFIAASLAFATTYTIIVFAALSAGITISPFIRWLQKLFIFVVNKIPVAKDKEIIKNGLTFPPIGVDSIPQIIFGLLFIGFVAFNFNKDFDQAFRLFLTIISMGFIYGFWNTKPRLREYKEGLPKKLKIGLALIAYIAPLIVIQEKGNILNQSMDMIGVRSENNIVQLSKKYSEFLTVNRISYKNINKDGDAIYENVTVLFRGIGSSTVLKIQDFSFSVPSKEVIIAQ